MNQHLKDKRVLITGASKGLWKAAAIAYENMGARLALSARSGDKLEALLAHAMLSIPASKGFEIGSGFKGSTMLGSQHNDLFIKKTNKIGTKTNNSGGIQGGISNGEDIFFRVAFKPVSSIMSSQKTVNKKQKEINFLNLGRHDPCVVSRAVPIVESMTAIVLMDMYLLNLSSKI